jgi:hypothetical protein
MQAALDQFRSNIQRVRHIANLYHYFSGVTTTALDLSDILRAQLVMAVSALDHYVHELTRLGMIEIVEGKRAQTPAFLRFQVPLDATLRAVVPSGGSGWLDNEVRSRHGYLAFQHPDKIADAVRLISTIELWNDLSTTLGIPVRDLKNRLQLIVDRRNKIAHEADIDPSYPGVCWPISASDVAGVTDFIEQLCEAIHVLVP